VPASTPTDPILLDLPTVIETPRLRMRPPQAGDGAALFAAVSESLVELRRFLASLPWVASAPSIEGSEIYCRTAQANFAARKDFVFLVFDQASGALVASTGLHRIVWATPKVEIGYWCRTSRAGNGFISEAVAALADYAFAQLGAVRVEIVTDEENIASRKVAERCGFALEGLLRHERRAPDGTLRNTCIYARLGAAR
jgi:RimJ/RimL family protein N-acetyltransferase